MRSTLILNTGMLVCLFPAFATAENAVEKIPQWVEQLGSTRFQVRERAIKSLEGLGEPALEALRKAAASEDLDIRERAAAAILRIEKELENRRYVVAPKFRFKFEETQLRSAIAEINRKTGMQLHLDEKLVSDPKRPVTLDTGEVTAWEAVAKLMEVAGLKDNDTPPKQIEMQGRQRAEIMLWSGRQPIQPQQQPNRIVLMDGRAEVASHATAFLRVRALPKEIGASVTRGAAEIGLTLDVIAAGQNSWRGTLSVDILKAIDEHGQSLTQSHVRGLPSVNPNLYEDFGIGGGWAMPVQQLAIESVDMPMGFNFNPRQVPLTFFAPKKSAKMVKEMEGVVHGRMMTPPQQLITIDDVSKVSGKETFRSGNFSLQVLETNLAPKTGQAKVRYRIETTLVNEAMMNNFGGGMVQFGGGMMIESDVMGFGPGQPQISLRDANGAAVPRTRIDMLTNSSNGMTMTQEMQITFPVSATLKTPIKLVVTGQKQVEVSVPFTLKNVPLP